MTSPDHVFMLFKQYCSYKRSGWPIGRFGQFKVNYFLDLLSLVHNKGDLRAIVPPFAKFVRRNGKPRVWDAIVAPKRGNVILGHAVGTRLGKPTAVARDNILFGRFSEGPIRSGHNVVIVDDVASDGEVLLDCVSNLRKDGVHTAAVYVLVLRKEGDAQQELRELGVDIFAAFELSDSELGELYHRR